METAGPHAFGPILLLCAMGWTPSCVCAPDRMADTQTLLPRPCRVDGKRQCLYSDKCIARPFGAIDGVAAALTVVLIGESQNADRQSPTSSDGWGSPADDTS